MICKYALQIILHVCWNIVSGCQTWYNAYNYEHLLANYFIVFCKKNNEYNKSVRQLLIQTNLCIRFLRIEDYWLVQPDYRVPLAVSHKYTFSLLTLKKIHHYKDFNVQQRIVYFLKYILFPNNHKLLGTTAWGYHFI